MRIKDANSKSNGDAGVVKGRDDNPSDTVYLGHIPSGFGEAEMRKFFLQFGDVSKVKLFRSKKTKGSKGYAFIKFDSVSTAKTVSDAMNGYFMGDRQLVSEVVPKWKCHKGMFLQPRKHKEGEGESSAKAIEDNNSQAELAKMSQNAKNNLMAKQKKLAALGIEYNFLDSLVGDDEDDKKAGDKKRKAEASEISSSDAKKKTRSGSGSVAEKRVDKTKDAPKNTKAEAKAKTSTRKKK